MMGVVYPSRVRMKTISRKNDFLADTGPNYFQKRFYRITINWVPVKPICNLGLY